MNKILKSPFIILLVLFVVNSCSHIPPKTSPLPLIAANEVSFMVFNVENLFDTQHDADREDYTYLPLHIKKRYPEIEKACLDTNDTGRRKNECLTTDWNESQLDLKLINLTKVVEGVDNRGPDVLMLIEVENERVLKIWSEKYLKKANYSTVVLIEGPDKRGIDVGLMSRLPLAGKPVLHQIPWQPQVEKDREYMFRSRNILEVPLKSPKGETITVFVAHFPSQANPTYWRKQAATHLAKLIKDKGPNAMVVAGGDLNITMEEESSEGYFKNILGSAGAVSHFVGCKQCPGTHNYSRSWSFLDAMIYSPALLEKGTGAYKLMPATIDVIRYDPIHLKQGKYPKRWDYEKMDGVSDHFPLYVRLRER